MQFRVRCRHGTPYVVRTYHAGPGAVGRGSVGFPASRDPKYTAGGPQSVNVRETKYRNPVRAGYSFDISDVLNGAAPCAAADDNYNPFDLFRRRSHRPGRRRRRRHDAAGRSCAAGRADAAVGDSGGHQRHGQACRVECASGGLVNSGADDFGRVEFNSYFRPPGSPGIISTSQLGGGRRPGAIESTIPATGPARTP